MRAALGLLGMRGPNAGRGLVVVGTIFLGAAAAACGDDAETTTQPGRDAGRDSSVTPTDSGTRTDATTSDSGTKPDATGTDASDAATDSPVTVTDGGSDASDASDARADGGDSGITLPVPVVLQLATGRHARLFNLVYTAAGIYAVGQVGDTTDPDDMATLLVKLLPTGALDTAFGTNGVVIKNVVVGKGGEAFRGLVVQSNGKIVVSGTVEHNPLNADGGIDATRDIAVVRFASTGAVDTTFGTAGVVRLPLTSGENVQQWGLSTYANDDLLVVGAQKGALTNDAGAPINEFAVVRLKGDTGALETTFAPTTSNVFRLPFPTNVSPKTATILADNTAIVCGYTNFGGNKPIVFKITALGVLDTTFATNGVFFPENGIPGFGTGGGGEAYGAMLQGDKIVTAGYGRENNGQPANGWLSFRFLANGTLDTTYGTAGHVFIPINGQGANARGMTVLADKRVVMTGGASPPKPTADAGTQSQFAGAVVLTENGALDPTINPQGPLLFDLGPPAVGRAAHFFHGAAVSPDQKNVAIVGVKGGITPVPDAGVVGTFDQAAFLLLPTGN